MTEKNKSISSYELALEELQEIVAALQEESIGIDDLSEKVKRAATLIQYCKNKLRNTEEEIQDLFAQDQ
ncbi:MAG: exodeoxyribonuclease VII small subunit [Bacteroidota bacterium]